MSSAKEEKSEKRGFLQSLLDKAMKDKIKWGPKGGPNRSSEIYRSGKKTRGGSSKSGGEAWEALAMAEDMD